MFNRLLWRSGTSTHVTSTEPAMRIKTQRAMHDWRVVGGYTELGSGIWQYPVECACCGEHRDTTADFARFSLICAYGCARDGFTGRYERGDQVIINAGRISNALAQFVNYLPDGRIAASGFGNDSYVEDPKNVRPDLVGEPQGAAL